ncbi:hypothetical protein HNY73_007839 [Argiope bruennichi]|uniref:Uncharacterized protein n=1 Tax=Argiope bruennichi TaxID=94029 RepID=A0A8T0F4E1_ARGBR|nr:hypothetical protein HNY73_007839 [Argiope bruennichi]
MHEKSKMTSKNEAFGFELSIRELFIFFKLLMEKTLIHSGEGRTSDASELVVGYGNDEESSTDEGTGVQWEELYSGQLFLCSRQRCRGELCLLAK